MKMSVRGYTGRSPRVPELPISCLLFNLIPKGLTNESYDPNKHWILIVSYHVVPVKEWLFVVYLCKVYDTCASEVMNV